MRSMRPPPHLPHHPTASIQAQTAIIQPHVSTGITGPEASVDQLDSSGCSVLVLILGKMELRR